MRNVGGQIVAITITSNSRSDWVEFFKGYVLIALCLALAWVLANVVGLQHYGLGLLVLAMVVGIGVGNVSPVYIQRLAAPAAWCRNYPLRLGLGLSGFQIGLSEVQALGWMSALSAIAIVTSVLSVSSWLGRRLGLSKRQAFLVGMGGAVCGAAAIAATESVWKGPQSETAAALATAAVFGSIGMFGLPLLGHYLQLSDLQLGVWYGLAIHEMGHVVGAGQLSGNSVVEIAILEKMIRVSLLAPCLMILGCVLLQRSSLGEDMGSKPVLSTWFLWLFLLGITLNSAGWVTPEVRVGLGHLSAVGLGLGMVALGFGTRWDALRAAGLRVWILGALICIQLWIVSLILVHLFHFGAGAL